MARGVEVLLLLTQSTRRCGGCGFALKYVIAQRTGEEGEEDFCDYIHRTFYFTPK